MSHFIEHTPDGARRYFAVLDKSDWGPGPWQSEPDKVQFSASGLDALIVRNESGALCGYVGVPKAHPWHGKGYDEVEASAHGGLTFAGPCAENGHEAWTDWCKRVRSRLGEAERYPKGDMVRLLASATPAALDDFSVWQRWIEARAICHVGEESVWWFGFDCAHSGDISPAMNEYRVAFKGDKYRDMNYVMAQVQILAAQVPA